MLKLIVNFISLIREKVKSGLFHSSFILLYFFCLVILREFIPYYDDVRGYLFVVLISLAGIRFGLKGGLICALISIIALFFERQVPGRQGLIGIISSGEYVYGIVYLITGLIIGIFTEIDRSIKRKLRVLAQFDGLTNCFNYRKIIDCLEHELFRAKRYKREFSIALLDIDFFKQINDAYGHLVGNEILQVFSRLLTGSLRNVDLIGRYGGEEFLIILPETSSNRVPEILRRFKNCLKDVEIKSPYLKAPLKLTIRFSAGIAAYPSHGDNVNQLISVADYALHEAKRSGRDKSIIEKRGFIRFKPFKGLNISLINSSNNEVIKDFEIADISKGGFRIKTKLDIQAEKFSVKMTLPNDRGEYSINCVLSYKQKTEDNQFYIGFYFTDIKPSLQSKIYNNCTTIAKVTEPLKNA